MVILWSESRGNAVKKANGSLWLRKLKIDVLTVQRRAPRLSVSDILNVNNSLNIKIWKKKCKDFWFLIIQIIFSYNNGTFFPHTLQTYTK